MCGSPWIRSPVAVHTGFFQLNPASVLLKILNISQLTLYIFCEKTLIRCKELKSHWISFISFYDNFGGVSPEYYMHGNSVVDYYPTLVSAGKAQPKMRSYEKYRWEINVDKQFFLFIKYSCCRTELTRPL